MLLHPKNKKLKIILLVILIFLLGIVIGFWMGKIKYSVPASGQSQNESAVSPSGDEKTFVGDSAKP